MLVHHLRRGPTFYPASAERLVFMRYEEEQTVPRGTSEFIPIHPATPIIITGHSHFPLTTGSLFYVDLMVGQRRKRRSIVIPT